jgi:hypothetical protein
LAFHLSSLIRNQEWGMDLYKVVRSPIDNAVTPPVPINQRV